MQPDDRAETALVLVGAYTALGTWMWFAWYKDKPTLTTWKSGGDGWLEAQTYAGGADKFGHAWANLVLSRLGTDLLRSGGWGRLSSSLLSTGVCWTAFFLVEVNDGWHTEFSPGDLTSNTLGALAAVAMSNWPVLDAAIDFRVQWFPSREFRRKPNADLAEDYSGETFLLAFKPGSLAAIRDSGPASWLQFINPVIGFESRNYQPAPRPGDSKPRQQRVFIGVTLDLQAVIDTVLGTPSSATERWSHAVGHTWFEYVNLPFATLPIVSATRTSPGLGR